MISLPYYSEYINYLQKNNYSPSAIGTYKYGLQNFYNYLQENNYEFNQIDLNLINNYILRLNTLSAGTAHIYSSALKNYLLFLKKIKKNEMDFDINEIDKTKKCKKINKDIDWKEINNIIESINPNKSAKSLRDYLVFQLIIKTGLRISDLVKIKKNDIVNGKLILESGEIVLDIKTLKLINKLIVGINTKTIYLFNSLSPNQKENKHLNVRSVERMLREYITNYSYNELRLIYYKLLINQLPNIRDIYKHKTTKEKIRLEKIIKII